MDLHNFPNPVFDRCLYSFLFFGDRLLNASRAVITRAPPYRTPCAEPDRTSLRQTIPRPASDNSQSHRASPAQVLRSSRPLAPSRALLPSRPAPPPRAAPFAPCPPETHRRMPECAAWRTWQKSQIRVQFGLPSNHHKNTRLRVSHVIYFVLSHANS